MTHNKVKKFQLLIKHNIPMKEKLFIEELFLFLNMNC